ncbi:FAD-dependent oxidoreductase [Moorella sulfitireducens]|uniref:FAD-dependent oxidoreductase n=1 Tax=Neomoorella sulfitireducens TaxID=2972948 RepID=UPI0021ABBDA7|nr:FAD-dependent oxidoreductase [Moorella sulfitireducens]
MQSKQGLCLVLSVAILAVALAGLYLWQERTTVLEEALYYLTVWRSGQAVAHQEPDPATLSPAPPPVEGARYDVLVVGGQPEGVAAAISAARQGARVLLVEKRDGLGGLFTYGWLNFIDMNYGPKYELLTCGTFLDFYRQVGGNVFDVAVAKKVFLEMVERYPNLALSLNTAFKEPILEGSKLIGIRAVRDGRDVSLYAGRIIDATQDADVAAAAGVPYTIGAEDMGDKQRRQAVTLVFHLGGIDWAALKQAVNAGQFKDTKISDRAAWGFADIGSAYQPSTPRLRLRGLNIGRQDDGTILINALQIFGVDGLSEAAKAEAMQLAREELPAITAFLRSRLPGFAGAILLGTAPELYVRETRHIKALYQLDLSDVLFNRYFPDAIALGSYPVDVQATSPQDKGYVYGRPEVYSIPFRSLVPREVDNLLVVGRSAGYTHLAAGSARVVPVGMATGDAAGVAAAYSLKANKNFRELAAGLEDIKAIQDLLVKAGANLKDYKIKNPFAEHWAFAGLQFVNRWGLIVAGYNNDWKLEAPVNQASFYYMTANALKWAAGRGDLVAAKAAALQPFLEREPLTRGNAARLLLTYLGEDAAVLDPAVAVARAGAWSLLPVEKTGSDPRGIVTGAEAYYAIERLCALVGKR